MCIRDRAEAQREHDAPPRRVADRAVTPQQRRGDPELAERCLLYTSDAADERSSVDLGGSRIIKKNQRAYNNGYSTT